MITDRELADRIHCEDMRMQHDDYRREIRENTFENLVIAVCVLAVISAIAVIYLQV